MPQPLEDALYTVTDIYPEHVVLDGNHPLAGIALRIEIKVEAVREATEEEIGRGSAGYGLFRIAPPRTRQHHHSLLKKIAACGCITLLFNTYRLESKVIPARNSS